VVATGNQWALFGIIKIGLLSCSRHGLKKDVAL
jgi:hypothetical protein